jgi:hypothetical protein
VARDERCPHCKASLVGDQIAREHIAAYGRTHFSLATRTLHRGRSLLMCPSCKGVWDPQPDLPSYEEAAAEWEAAVREEFKFLEKENAIEGWQSWRDRIVSDFYHNGPPDPQREIERQIEAEPAPGWLHMHRWKQLGSVERWSKQRNEMVEISSQSCRCGAEREVVRRLDAIMRPTLSIRRVPRGTHAAAVEAAKGDSR